MVEIASDLLIVRDLAIPTSHDPLIFVEYTEQCTIYLQQCNNQLEGIKKAQDRVINEQ